MKRKLNTAHIILYDVKRRFLFQHRSSDAKRLPGYWAFFGGGIERGEKPLEAVYRETFEELAYTLKAPEYVFEQDFKIDGIEGRMRVYIEAFKGDKSALKLQEGQGWGWYSIQETKQLKMIDHDRLVIEKIVEHIAKKQMPEIVR